MVRDVDGVAASAGRSEGESSLFSATSVPWPMRRSEDPVTVLAHRGGTGPWHENSLEAFSAALDLGADGVELDVRRSVDGALVVHHDAEVPGTGLIHERRRDQLPSWVPSLEQALETCAGSIVNVEIKNLPTDPGYDPAEAVAADVATLLAEGVGPIQPWPTHVVVSSFWPDTLAAVRTVHDDIPLAILVHPSLDAVAALDTAAALGCVALNPHHSRVSAALVGQAHERGLAVITWTVNRPEDIDAVLEAGVDVLITDSVKDTLDHLGRS
jgi:glycerophosphoryl diester phosphodiesterase